MWGATVRGAVHGKKSEHFNPRSPCGERRVEGTKYILNYLISIHAPRVGSDIIDRDYQGNENISIHAPRVGSDVKERQEVDGARYFNPRSPCGERQQGGATNEGYKRFQSTLPVWGATFASRSICAQIMEFQSTLPVWGATSADLCERCVYGISIHAPRVGSDMLTSLALTKLSSFQSTLPVWGATCGRRHTPAAPRYFNPRSPCGERQDPEFYAVDDKQFQSTLPVWGATLSVNTQGSR